MYSLAGTLLYRETEVDASSKIGNDINYIYLGKKLIAKDGLISDTSGSSQQHYKPFGESIEGEKDDVGYTGHKFDTDLGLSYMQARYYDPVIGRFYSNDPIGFRDVHSFNRYAYANNNPYKYTDPDGNNPRLLQAVYRGGFIVGEALNAAAFQITGATLSTMIVNQVWDIVHNESTNLADDDATNHILDGDEDGGGHGPGRNKPGKSEFPSDWSDDVMDAISDVVTDPDSKTKPARDGRTKTSGKRNGVKIDVITGNTEEGGKIITAWPDNMPRNPEKEQ